MVDPTIARAWIRIVRDMAVTFVASFMLIYETVVIANPNAYIIGAGLTLLGIPPVLRLDEYYRARGGPEA